MDPPLGFEVDRGTRDHISNHPEFCGTASGAGGTTGFEDLELSTGFDSKYVPANPAAPTVAIVDMDGLLTVGTNLVISEADGRADRAFEIMPGFKKVSIF